MAAAEAPRQPDAAAAIDARVVKALGHPTRVRILNLLREREMVSPVELGAELGLAVGTVGYHVRRLEALGFIELAKRTPRRGAVEHHYRARATLEPLLPVRSRPVAGDVSGRAVGACRAAQEALAHGGFDAVSAGADVRLVTLDARGREQLRKQAGRQAAAVERIARASARRGKRSGATEQARAGTAVTMVFEAEPDGG